MEQAKSKRTLKVRKGFYRYSNKPHPFISLAGHYLKAFDFKAGDVVELTLAEGVIVIRKVERKN